MLKSLGQLIERTFGEDRERVAEDRKHAIQVATAALLVEVMRADYEEDLVENEMVFELLKRHFDLSDEEAKLLVEAGGTEAERAASLQGFTRLLHENLAVEEKQAIVEMLWDVALADDHLDKHEDYLVRKVAGLLYVSHSDLIRIRNRVRERRS